jgi:Protein of unknown function DUF72
LFYSSWRRGFYPASFEPGEWFNHYARSFNTVELNARWPTIAAVKAWRRQVVRRRFVYTATVNELVTHTRRVSRTAELVKAFGLIADLLGPGHGMFPRVLSTHVPAWTGSSLSSIQRTKNVVGVPAQELVEQKVYEAFREVGRHAAKPDDAAWLWSMSETVRISMGSRHPEASDRVLDLAASANGTEWARKVLLPRLLKGKPADERRETQKSRPSEYFAIFCPTFYVIYG